MTTTSGTHQTRIYRLSGENGYVSNSYTSNPLTAFGWVLDPASGAVKVSVDGLPHAAISFRAYCRVYQIDAASLKTALVALNRKEEPETPPKPLLTTDQATYIADKMAAYASVKNSAISGDLGSFSSRLAEMRSLLDSGFAGAPVARYSDFYASAATVASINLLFSNLANDLFYKIKGFVDADAAVIVTPP